jgi:hypothetical protein
MNYGSTTLAETLADLTTNQIFVNITFGDDNTTDDKQKAAIRDWRPLLMGTGANFFSATPRNLEPLYNRLYGLAATNLERVRNLTHNHPGWIDTFMDGMQLGSSEMELENANGPTRVRFYPDEQLVLRKVLARYFMQTLRQEELLNDGQVVMKLEPASLQALSIDFVEKDKWQLPVLFQNLTTYESHLSCLTMLQTKTQEGGTFRYGRMLWDYAKTLKKSEDEDISVVMCDSDVRAWEATAFCSGVALVITARDTADTDNLFDPANVDYQEPAPTASTLTRLTTYYHATLPYTQTAEGRVTYRNWNAGNRGKPLPYAEVIKNESNSDAMANILSPSMDVCDYGLPLLRHGISARTWARLFVPLLKVFRKHMQSCFEAFINWKIQFSVYLKKIAFAVRREDVIKWRTLESNNDPFFVKYMISRKQPPATDTVPIISRFGRQDSLASYRMSWAFAVLVADNPVVPVEDLADYDSLETTLQDPLNRTLLAKLAISLPSCLNMYVSVSHTRELLQICFKGWSLQTIYHYIETAVLSLSYQTDLELAASNITFQRGFYENLRAKEIQYQSGGINQLAQMRRQPFILLNKSGNAAIYTIDFSIDEYSRSE